jgi:fatty-acyl-CoA synthase
VAQRLTAAGITYVEGYGLTETMAATHINPIERPKAGCLGIPVFGVESTIIDPATLEPLSPGEIGEIVIHGPQVMLGYWNKPEDSAAVFVELDGKRFLRSGDLGRMDEDGYFFMVDRLKRMINASGFKVWPAEVENLMHQHGSSRGLRHRHPGCSSRRNRQSVPRTEATICRQDSRTGHHRLGARAYGGIQGAAKD